MCLANLEVLLRDWIVFGEWETRSTAESEGGGGRGGVRREDKVRSSRQEQGWQV